MRLWVISSTLWFVQAFPIDPLGNDVNFRETSAA